MNISNELIKSATTLRQAGIGSMSPNTLLIYNDIYAKFRFHREFMKCTKAVELTAYDACCSVETVWKVVKLMKSIV